jgi:hypothetical protein
MDGARTAFESIEYGAVECRVEGYLSFEIVPVGGVELPGLGITSEP